ADRVIFFFQAEDGIRDWSVTGVQTCALPICPVQCSVRILISAGEASGEMYGAQLIAALRFQLFGMQSPEASALQVRSQEAVGDRSEERRVGKEGRSRGWSGR